MWLKGVAEDVAWAVVGSVDGGTLSRNGLWGWRLIANVVEGVAYRVSPVSPLGL